MNIVLFALELLALGIIGDRIGAWWDRRDGR